MPAWVSSPVHRAVVVGLIDARKAAGLTQREVASRLGKPRSFIGKIEANERNLSVLEYLALAKVIGVDAASLLGGAASSIAGDIEI